MESPKTAAIREDAYAVTAANISERDADLEPAIRRAATARSRRHEGRRGDRSPALALDHDAQLELAAAVRAHHERRGAARDRGADGERFAPALGHDPSGVEAGRAVLIEEDRADDPATSREWSLIRMSALADEIGRVQGVDSEGASLPGRRERGPVGLVDDLLVSRADDVVGDANGVDLAAEDIGEASPPRGIEGEDIGALALVEALDELDDRGDAVHRRSREGEASVAAEPEAVDRSDAREIRDSARVADQNRARPRGARSEASGDLDLLSGDVGAGPREVIDLRREEARGSGDGGDAREERCGLRESVSAAREGACAEERRGQEHRDGGRRVAEVLKARGRVERDEEERPHGP